MRILSSVAMAFITMISFASAEPFQEVTAGVPVSSIVESEAWYLDLLGPNVVAFSEFTDPDGNALELYDLS